MIPANKQFANLRKVVENAVYAQANDLIKGRKYKEAAKKFIAFQKEFPKSPNADTALFMASTAFLATNLVDDAVSQMEALLKLYPKSRHGQKVRWNAAEKSRAIGQLLRAAKHYEAYARQYPQDGLRRKAWKLAGEMHLGLGRYASAISDYEKYLAQTKAPRERIEMAKTLADLQFRYGKATQAIAALDRVMKLSKSVDDEIWAQSLRIEILMRLGQEKQARAVINRVLKLRPTTQEGFQTLAKAKFALARIEADQVRKRDPLREKNLLKGLQGIAEHYKKTGTMLLAPCEVPGLALCAEGYYQRARLAEDLAKMLPDIAPPPTLSPKEAKPVRDYISKQARLFASEAKAFALRAESALSTGSPSPDMAERIRSYARKFRGDEADEGGIE